MTPSATYVPFVVASLAVRGYYDAVVIDTYDSEGNVPEAGTALGHTPGCSICVQRSERHANTQGNRVSLILR